MLNRPVVLTYYEELSLYLNELFMYNIKSGLPPCHIKALVHYYRMWAISLLCKVALFQSRLHLTDS